ncbi:GNAT family N-acetyltransferase [Sabulicella glaciei]|uniref:GNAT family N-acetyltransferase n=1 Tax=Sabulicella glaciei TaxID=2984948 RepID=A0ABT3NTY3_9PROT|nr:GNAT family N-acetyltransferase [Roseococcus sp. MDT2-1-1]
MSLRIETLRGEALLRHLPRLGHLRGAVFREWPYLYEAEGRYETNYLRQYAEGEGAAVIVGLDGEEAVGASTCQPMREAHAPVRQAFEEAGRDPAEHSYFGESVLLPEYRGQGVGVAFFTKREEVAREAGLRFAAFCAVERDAEDPRRPPGHVPLDGFWRKRGYTHHPDIACRFNWREIGGAAEVPHHLSFWIKTL